jgi:protein-S-isoprenylcysteine O-methyltransferase Ste14
MSGLVRPLLMLMVGLFIFIGLPVLVWGVHDLQGFFGHPARLAYAIVTVLIQLYTVFAIAEPGSRRGRESDRSLQRRIVLILIQLFSLAIVVAAPYSDSRHIAALAEADAIRYLGLAMFAVGFALMTWAEATLGKQFSVEVAIQEQHQLITHGPFRHLRHPRYLGIILFSFGISLIFNSLPALLFAMALTLTLLWRVRDEENLLHRQFGPAWEKYRQHSWSLIPFIY